jgi:hypothetical protein
VRECSETDAGVVVVGIRGVVGSGCWVAGVQRRCDGDDDRHLSDVRVGPQDSVREHISRGHVRQLLRDGRPAGCGCRRAIEACSAGPNPGSRGRPRGPMQNRPAAAGQIPIGGGSEPVRTGFGPVRGCRGRRGQAVPEIYDHAGHDRARRATEADGSMANRAGRTARWRIGPKRPDRFAIEYARSESQPVRQNKASPRDHRVLRRTRTATHAPRST